MAGHISNLMLIIVFAISLGKCEETSSPETTHLEVTGLNEEPRL